MQPDNRTPHTPSGGNSQSTSLAHTTSQSGPLSLDELLGHTPSECHQVTNMGQYAGAPGMMAVCRTTGSPVPPPLPLVHVYFGPNLMHPFSTGHSGAAHVTRLVAVYVGVDVKPGGCSDLRAAWALVDALSAQVGTRPVAVILSGHGLQALWAAKTGSHELAVNQCKSSGSHLVGG